MKGAFTIKFILKGYNAQNCLIALIEKWKKVVDNGGAFGALLTDLSKAFDSVVYLMDLY